MVLSLALGISSIGAAEANCYLGACVGDRAVNISRENREVTVVAVDQLGKFVLRFEDSGQLGGNWDRADIALRSGCAGDLCIGYPAYNVSRDNRAVTVYALQYDGKFVLRFNDISALGAGWDRWDLAVAWGCVGNICVNDRVYNRTLNREAIVAAIQNNTRGQAERFLLNFAGALGGNWELSDLVLISRGTPSYPPAPYCPPGTHWDPRTNSCVRDLPPPPPPPPYCPPGTHYDPRIGRCVANPPPPPRDWTCSITKPGRVFTGRGPTRGAATSAALRQCAAGSGGYVCRASDAFCSQ